MSTAVRKLTGGWGWFGELSGWRERLPSRNGGDGMCWQTSTQPIPKRGASRWIHLPEDMLCLDTVRYLEFGGPVRYLSHKHFKHDVADETVQRSAMCCARLTPWVAALSTRHLTTTRPIKEKELANQTPSSLDIG